MAQSLRARTILPRLATRSRCGSKRRNMQTKEAAFVREKDLLETACLKCWEATEQDIQNVLGENGKDGKRRFMTKRIHGRWWTKAISGHSVKNCATTCSKGKRR